MTSPGKTRQTALPLPGRNSSIPALGRPRSVSNFHQSNTQTPNDELTRAFSDALKANDPSQHRSLSQSTSTSSLSVFMSTSRPSIGGRPSSSASASSTAAKQPERAKTPVTRPSFSRPASRQSDILPKPTRNNVFEVGDNVRIESLGYEGKLRYLGEIQGKPGIWAGVELGGGFAGKGKNNGSVAGIQYFSCPDNCGVFVASTKLSAATVSPTFAPRAPSVASVTSSKGGRGTPSFGPTSRAASVSYTNGRSSTTNGRVTPSVSTGRLTPGMSTSTLQRPFKPLTAKPSVPSLSDKITAGSRASKYASMTAQQLSSRKEGPKLSSPSRDSTDRYPIPSSPIMNRSISSPTRPPASPFATPKPTLSRATGSSMSSPSRTRTSISTPRPRIPSGVAMPPPASPKPLFDDGMDSSQSMQDRIAAVAFSLASSRPSSSSSFRSTGTEEQGLIDQLQSRLEAMEYENNRLRNDTVPITELQKIKEEKQKALEKANELEKALKASEAAIAERVTEIESTKAKMKELAERMETITLESVALKDTEQERLDAHEKDVKRLKEELEKQLREQEEVITQTKGENERLVADLSTLQADFEAEREHLNIQVNDLRIAGKETIELYEERLSVMANDRYDLEARTASLEASLRTMAANERSQESQDQTSPNVPSATQIENESLREQVAYLQTRAEKLEEKLEEVRASSEREIMDYRTELETLRHEEEQAKAEVGLQAREIEKTIKAETAARLRVEEIEEALRESTVALENTRGEVETLRYELTNLDSLIGANGDGDITARVSNFIRKLSSEKSKAEQDALRWKQEAETKPITNGSHPDSSEETGILRERVQALEKNLASVNAELETRISEIESLRKKANRDTPINGIHEKSSAVKSDPAAREELTGLKHIVQELQKELQLATQRIRTLESENGLLSSERERLRDEVRILQENLDNSLRNDTTGTDDEQRKVKEQSLEMEQLRKRLNESEMKHSRAVHELNKEISELEALVESKIYREDELEREIERLKDKVTSREKKTPKAIIAEPVDGRNRLSAASLSTVSSAHSVVDEEVCEICERPGHDIFSCSMLKDEPRTRATSVSGLFCEECENPGHTAADCPHSLDVF